MGNGREIGEGEKEGGEWDGVGTGRMGRVKRGKRGEGRNGKGR